MTGPATTPRGTVGVPSDPSVDLETAPITLAPMRRRHLRTVLAHEKAVYARPWTMGLFLSELQRPETRSYVIARAGAVQVGHCGVLFVEAEGHVTTVVVAPAFQGHRVATRMLAYQFDAAIGRGATALTLEVRTSNHVAQSLYRRFGFVPAGIRRGYYAETGEDALIMWVHDIASPRERARRRAVVGSLAGPTVLDNLGSAAGATAAVGPLGDDPVGRDR